jgi:enterochelin esterase-like enzyme
MKSLGIIILLALTGFRASAQEANVTCGKIRHIENFPSKYVDPRNVDVWLPDNYDKKTKCAVLYMQDGQMLFDSSTTWNHQEWGIDETLTGLIKEKKIRDCIVVGIWNISKIRHAEYFPQKAFNNLSEEEKKMILGTLKANNTPIFEKEPLSDLYLQFLVKELKPFIDSAFSTLKDRKNTFIAGSSMGGLISLYAICEYPEIFGGAACLSTHWTGIYRSADNPLPGSLTIYLKSHLPSPGKHKIYFDYGSETLDSLYKPFQEKVDDIMRAGGYTSKNWMTKEFPGEDHSENAWRRRFSIPAEFLLGH